MTIVLRVLAIGFAAAVLAGCASPSAKFFLGEDAKPFSEQIKNCVDPWEKREQEEGVDEAIAETAGKKSAMNEFLDCITGVAIGQNAIEFRLLRGHLIVGVLAIYGEDSAGKSPSNKQKHATNILGHIERAESLLWEASGCQNSAAGADCTPLDPNTLTDARDTLRRIFAVLDLARAVSEPGKERVLPFGKSFITRISALITVPTPSGAIGLVKEGRRAAARIFTLRSYSAAYRSAVEGFLKEVTGRTPKAENWKRIDTAYLLPACKSLARMAGRKEDQHHCVPSGR